MQTLLELLREFRLSFPTAMAVVVAFLVLQGAMERFDSYLVARESYAQWVRDSCLPKAPNERAVARIDGDKLACNIYQNLDYGGSPRVISAAVMELP